MPLRNYIEGTVNNNLSAIIKRGVCSDELFLSAAWEEIKEQYAEAIGQEAVKLYTTLIKQIKKLQITYDQVELCIDLLSKLYVERVAKEINRLLHSNIKFDVLDKDGYDKALKSCRSRNKANKINIDLKLLQLEAIDKKETTGQPADESYYEEMLILLGDSKGITLSADTITVFQFATRIKHLNEEIAKKEKEVSKAR